MGSQCGGRNCGGRYGWGGECWGTPNDYSARAHCLPHHITHMLTGIETGTPDCPTT